MEMLIQPIYYAVFYDIAKPKTAHYAVNKRIDKRVFHNLVDDMGTKDIELKNSEGVFEKYRVISISTFQIVNTVDNHLFAVCECEKI
jgi:hypothetical protein